MKARAFNKKLRHSDIVQAIQSAERKTSGEIRVFISRKDIEEPLAAAEAYFLELGMNKTRERNGVLLFFAPRKQKFAVIGDTAVHAKCGAAFWNRLTKEMSGYFEKEEFSKGIIHGIELAGELLAAYFPRRSDDRNELSNQVESD
jgi:uncharacterized membrane protein